MPDRAQHRSGQQLRKAWRQEYSQSWRSQELYQEHLHAKHVLYGRQARLVLHSISRQQCAPVMKMKVSKLMRVFLPFFLNMRLQTTFGTCLMKMLHFYASEGSIWGDKLR